MTSRFASNSRWTIACTLSLALVGTTAEAGVLIVDPGDPGAFAEIQDALDVAAPLDTIQVWPGTYAPVVVMTDDLLIESALPGGYPVVDSAGGYFAVKIHSDGVTVRGLEVRNALGTGQSSYGLISFGNDTTLLDNRAVMNTVGFSVFGLNGGSGAVLMGNAAIDSRAAGFDLVFQAGAVVSGNSSIALGSDVGLSFGLAELGGGHNLFMENYVEGHVTGLESTLSNDSRFSRNVVIGSAFGFCVSHGSGLEVTGNQVRQSLATGIRLWLVDGMIVENNLVDGVVGRDGIAMNGTINSKFTANRVLNVSNDGFSIARDTDPEVPASSGNKFRNNRSNRTGGFGYFIGDDAFGNDYLGNSCGGNVAGGSNQRGICN